MGRAEKANPDSAYNRKRAPITSEGPAFNQNAPIVIELSITSFINFIKKVLCPHKSKPMTLSQPPSPA